MELKALSNCLYRDPVRGCEPDHQQVKHETPQKDRDYVADNGDLFFLPQENHNYMFDDVNTHRVTI